MRQDILLPASVQAVGDFLSEREPASSERLSNYALFLAALAVQSNDGVDLAVDDYVKGCAGPLLGEQQS